MPKTCDYKVDTKYKEIYGVFNLHALHKLWRGHGYILRPPKLFLLNKICITRLRKKSIHIQTILVNCISSVQKDFKQLTNICNYPICN